MTASAARRLAHVACGLGLAALAASLSSRPDLDAAQPSAADEYLALVDAYASGRTTASVEALVEHEDRWVERAQAAVMRQAAGWSRARVESAALLHTEVVVGGWVLPLHEPLHLGAARRFVELSNGSLVSPRFRHDWLLALTWHFQSELDLGALVPWLDDLRARYPDDAETLLATGIFYETLGWSPSLPTDLSWTSGSRTLRALRHHEQRDALDLAAAAYGSAARMPATRVQASIRLGRVLAELGRPDEARQALAPMTTAATERRWRYLAELFTALAEARAGNQAAEAAALERAAVVMPDCQTPLVGLAALRRLQGETAAAADLARTLTRGVKTCDDPWWFYRFGQPPDRLPQLLDQLRGAPGP